MREMHFSLFRSFCTVGNGRQSTVRWFARPRDQISPSFIYFLFFSFPCTKSRCAEVIKQLKPPCGFSPFPLPPLFSNGKHLLLASSPPPVSF